MKWSLNERVKQPGEIIHDYSLHEEVLENVSTAKYLRITVIDGPSWSNHINTVTSKTTKTGVPTPKLDIGFKRNQGCCIQSCGPTQIRVWKPHNQTKINRIENVQRTAARSACRNWRNPHPVNYVLH